MARRKQKVNKTQAIKDYLTANPGLAPREVAEALKEQGITVKPQYVSAIKSKSNLGVANVDGEVVADAPATRRRGRPSKSSSKDAGVAVGYKSLLEARSFVRSIGDVNEARKVLDAYANLQ